MEAILELANRLPAGLPDDKAPAKLVREWQELLEALDSDDHTGALTELADVVYYAAKSIHAAAFRCGVDIETAFAVAEAKYSLRAQPGNPKNDTAERAAVAVFLRKVMK